MVVKFDKNVTRLLKWMVLETYLKIVFIFQVTIQLFKN